MNGPEIPAEHYLAVGRIAVAAAKVDAMTGFIIHAATGEDVGFNDRTWLGIVGKSGEPNRSMKELLKQRPYDDRLAEFWSEREKLFKERGRILHSIVELVFPEPPKGEVFTARERTPLKWSMTHPKTLEDHPLPTPEEVDELVGKMNELSRRAQSLATRVAANYEPPPRPRSTFGRIRSRIGQLTMKDTKQLVPFLMVGLGFVLIVLALLP